MQLIEKVQKIAANHVSKSARKSDLNQVFPYHILTKFSATDLATFIRGSVESSKLRQSERAELFFHACKYCSNVRNYFLVSLGMVGTGIASFGTKRQKQKFIQNLCENRAIGALAISEARIGSNMAGMEASYKQVGNQFVLNGEKKWITLGDIADFFLIAANGPNGIQLFLVEAGNVGLSTKPITGILSNRGSHIASILLNDVCIPESAVLGENFFSSQRALKQILTTGRLIASIAAVAMAEAAFEEMLKYTKSRQQFGKRLFEHQLIQKRISDCKTQIFAGFSISLNAFNYENSNEVIASSHAAMAKHFNSQLIEDVTKNCLHALGANSISNSFSLERYYREATGFQFIEGTSEILTQLIAKTAILGYPKIWSQENEN